MVESDRAIPFGLLFEELAPEPQGFIAPTYDEERDLSYVKDPQGHRVPYVECGGALGTVTFTKVRTEDTDRDPEDDREYRPARVPLAGTQTVTEVRTESTDKD